jgi:hypothetical protein
MRRVGDAGNAVALQIQSESLTHSFFEANECDVVPGSISVSASGSTENAGYGSIHQCTNRYHHCREGGYYIAQTVSRSTIIYYNSLISMHEYRQ